jgi:hypothetical protein
MIYYYYIFKSNYLKLEYLVYKMNNLIFYPYNNQYGILLEYIYDKYEDKITNLVYLSEFNGNKYNYRFRSFNDRKLVKSIVPHDCDISFTHTIDDKEIEFNYKLELVMDKNSNPMKMFQSLGHEGGEDRISKKSILSSKNKKDLLKFNEIAKQYITDKHEIQKKSSNDTIRIYYYQKEYWNMLGKSPKRPIDTLYLKQGEKEKLISMIDDFFEPKTRDLYLSYGMPYKHVVMLYGIPGSGKTSTISAIASYFDSDIYTIPITKELTDYGLIDAFSDISDKEDKKRIIVLEDIDCIFDTTRKEGDEHNMVTLQSILNCLDGHMCAEGTLLFMTANNPEKMDYAMVRSCRIDYKLELGYADEYQTQNIFKTFLPSQGEKFRSFYKKIKHKQFTTAMLQEFLFYNRNCENILDHIPSFIEIVDKNKPSELKSDKKDSGLYM